MSCEPLFGYHERVMENRFDPWLLFATLALMGASLLTLGSLRSGYIARQAVWMVVGLAAMWLVSRVDRTLWRRWSVAVWACAVVVLTAVLVFGEVRGGTRGWFALGPVSVQPSEFARVAVAIAVARIVSDNGGRSLSAPRVLAVLGLGLQPAVLVAAQPDLGVALSYLPLIGGALWVGGLPRATWAVLILMVFVGAGAGWQWGLAEYQRERIITVLDPERDPYGAGYQVRQSKIAVGSGRLVGTGFGRGSQSTLRFLPARHTDFAFAVWNEAAGFVGGILLLSLYALLLWRLAVIGLSASHPFGVALVGTLSAGLAFQILVNVGMVLGWLPVTGITLPLMSYGGSSIVSTCLALGCVHGVWSQRLVNQ